MPEPPLPLHELAPRLAELWTAALTSMTGLEMHRALLAAADASVHQGQCLRLSYGADCRRRRWYEHHRPEAAAPPDIRTLIKFSGGHVWEATFLRFASQALAESELGGAGLGYWLDPDWQQAELTHPIYPEIKGHPDGALMWAPGEGWDSVPVAIWDAKRIASWSWPKWEKGRMPDPLWGYRHQAGNYLAAASANRGVDFPGFLWICGLEKNGTVDKVEVGYAYRDELLGYADDATAAYEVAMAAQEPPPPCVPNRDSSPCRDRDTIYCPFYATCCEGMDH